MPHQRVQPAVEALANGHEAPAAVLAIQLAQHDRPLAGEVAAAEVEAREFALRTDEAQATRLQLRHERAAVGAGHDAEPFDPGRQAGEPEAKAPGVDGNGAARRRRLVEEGHVALVGQLAAGVEREAGEVQRQALRRQAGLQDAVRSRLRQGQALAAFQLFHVSLQSR